jgi:uncharacterized membrane protein
MPRNSGDLLSWLVGGAGVVLLFGGVFAFFTMPGFILPSIAIILIGLILMGAAWYLWR